MAHYLYSFIFPMNKCAEEQEPNERTVNNERTLAVHFFIDMVYFEILKRVSPKVHPFNRTNCSFLYPPLKREKQTIAIVFKRFSTISNHHRSSKINFLKHTSATKNCNFLYADVEVFKSNLTFSDE